MAGPANTDIKGGLQCPPARILMQQPRPSSTPTQSASSCLFMPQPLSWMATTPLAVAGLVPDTTSDTVMERRRGALFRVARRLLSTNSARAYTKGWRPWCRGAGCASCTAVGRAGRSSMAKCNMGSSPHGMHASGSARIMETCPSA